MAVGTGDVVAEAEVLVQEHGAFGDGLVAICADFFVGGGGQVIGYWLSLDAGRCGNDLEMIGNGWW